MKPSWRRIMLGILVLAWAGGIASFDTDILVSTIVNTRHLSLRAGSSKRFFRGQLHKMVAVPIFWPYEKRDGKDNY